jgi:hypothetical protein
MLAGPVAAAREPFPCLNHPTSDALAARAAGGPSLRPKKNLGGRYWIAAAGRIAPIGFIRS